VALRAPESPDERPLAPRALRAKQRTSHCLLEGKAPRTNLSHSHGVSPRYILENQMAASATGPSATLSRHIVSRRKDTVPPVQPDHSERRDVGGSTGPLRRVWVSRETASGPCHPPPRYAIRRASHLLVDSVILGSRLRSLVL